jgi:5-methyltetrahydrofolate--homocysteine methyltransferase
MPTGVCPEAWILEHPEVLIDLQRQYVRAGSRVLYAPTFSANRVKLQEYGLYERMPGMIKDLVTLSKEAIRLEGNPMGQVFVAGDLTMTGEMLRPHGTMELEELIEVYKEQIRYLLNAGVDLLVAETMMSLREARAALLAAREVCDLPMMITMTMQENGRTLYGTDAATIAVVLSSLGASAIGLNCSTGPAQMKALLREMAQVTDLPIIAKPNAGLPRTASDQSTYYDLSSQDFAKQMMELIQEGASMVGGCCGTTPEYIEALYQTIEQNHNASTFPSDRTSPDPKKRFLSSERRTISFTTDSPFFLIGERINPTGKKKLQAELRKGRLDMVRTLAREQEASGALILDVNMGMSGISEIEMMGKAIEAIGEASDLPLCIDSSSPEVMEAALRQYPGRALVNSVSLEKEKINRILPIAVKYGAMFVLLPLSDQGLPSDFDEKKKNIEAIVDKALQMGYDKKDICVDGLVTTVGANPNAAMETLQTIRYCKEAGYLTVCGLSNISFGMPHRHVINAAFLTLAIREGLTMAIANSGQLLTREMAFASDLLMGKEGAATRYITASQEWEEAALIESPPKSAGNKSTAVILREEKHNGVNQDIYQAVLRGEQDRITQLTKDALQNEEKAESLLHLTLLPAINEVGDLFEKGRYFLPQLISSAEAMKRSVQVLEPYLAQDETTVTEKPVIIIATVEGDIHDIGKNLVALMLRNHGFAVIDLGKDVKKQDIVQAAITHKAKIIALSALMTTTMQQMRDVVDFVKEANLPVKILIGGAVTTNEYANAIRADGYAKDAAGAVRVAKTLLAD